MPSVCARLMSCPQTCRRFGAGVRNAGYMRYREKKSGPEDAWMGLVLPRIRSLRDGFREEPPGPDLKCKKTAFGKT